MGRSGRVPDIERVRQWGQPERVEEGAERFGFSQIKGQAFFDRSQKQQKPGLPDNPDQEVPASFWPVSLFPGQGRTQITPEFSEPVISPSDNPELSPQTK